MKKPRLDKKRSAAANGDESHVFEDVVVQAVEQRLAQAQEPVLAIAKDAVEHLRGEFSVQASLFEPATLILSAKKGSLVSSKDIISGAYVKKRDAILEKAKALLKPEIVKVLSLEVSLADLENDIAKFAPGASIIKHAKAETPQYNQRIVRDIVRLNHEARFKEAVKRNENLDKAMLLLRDWFSRNQPRDLFGAFPLVIPCMFLSDLIMKDSSRLWTQASTFQLFRRALKWIAELPDDLSGNTPSRQAIRLAGNTKLDGFDDDAFLRGFRFVIIDHTNACNLGATTLPSAFMLLRGQARAALATDDEELMFLSRVSSLSRFDLTLRVPAPPPPQKGDTSLQADEEALALMEGSWLWYVLCRLEMLVQKGLVDTGRALRFGLFKLADAIVLGLSLDPEKAFRLVDRGPPAEDAVAAGKFRALWGSRAEMRRFKDGAIVEAVVWEDERRRRRIPQRIVDHLLSIHPPFARHVASIMANEPREGISFTASLAKPLESIDHTQDEDDACKAALDLAQVVEGALRKCEDIPLKIVEVVFTQSPALRYTGFVPQQSALAFASRDVTARNEFKARNSSSTGSRLVQIAGEMLMKLEGSSKWPDDEDARLKLECALLAQIARKLEEQVEGIDEEAPPMDCAVSRKGSLDVLIRGYAFRVRPFKSGKDEQYVRTHALLHALHHRAEASASRSLGLACRLARRWVSGHRFSSVLGDDIIDLIVASLFSHHDPPRGPLSSLLRFLDLLATFDWARRPLLVDLVDSKPFTKAIRDRADEAFFALKASNQAPTMVIFAKTKSDVNLAQDDTDPISFWLKPYGVEDLKFLSDSALRMITERARDTRKLIQKLCALAAGQEKQSAELVDLWTACFSSDPSAGVDAVLHLADYHTLFPQQTSGNDLTQYQNLSWSLSKLAVIGLDPVSQLVSELNQHFGHYCEFFVGDVKVPGGTQACTSIGVLWKQPVTAPFAFKLGSAKLATPDALDSTRLDANVDEILDEIARVGRGFVLRIDRIARE